jgi:molybdenum cofactor guanylyltransferase
MGRDKASLPFGGEPLLARVVRLALEAVDDVVIVAREGQTLPDRCDVAAVRDPVEGLGPLAALAVGLRHVAGDRAFVTGCDTPFLRPALIRRLLDLSSGYDAAVPLVDGRVMTTAAVYTRAVVDVADALVAERRLRVSDLVDRVRARTVLPEDLRDVDPTFESFRNCNTPESYAEALRDAGF